MNHLAEGRGVSDLSITTCSRKAKHSKHRSIPFHKSFSQEMMGAVEGIAARSCTQSPTSCPSTQELGQTKSRWNNIIETIKQKNMKKGSVSGPDSSSSNSHRKTRIFSLFELKGGFDKNLPTSCPSIPHRGSSPKDYTAEYSRQDTFGTISPKVQVLTMKPNPSIIQEEDISAGSGTESLIEDKIKKRRQRGSKTGEELKKEFQQLHEKIESRASHKGSGNSIENMSPQVFHNRNSSSNTTWCSRGKRNSLFRIPHWERLCERKKFMEQISLSISQDEDKSGIDTERKHSHSIEEDQLTTPYFQIKKASNDLLDMDSGRILDTDRNYSSRPDSRQGKEKWISIIHDAQPNQSQNDLSISSQHSGYSNIPFYEDEDQLKKENERLNQIINQQNMQIEDYISQIYNSPNGQVNLNHSLQKYKQKYSSLKAQLKTLQEEKSKQNMLVEQLLKRIESIKSKNLLQDVNKAINAIQTNFQNSINIHNTNGNNSSKAEIQNNRRNSNIEAELGKVATLITSIEHDFSSLFSKSKSRSPFSLHLDLEKVHKQREPCETISHTLSTANHVSSESTPPHQKSHNRPILEHRIAHHKKSASISKRISTITGMLNKYLMTQGIVPTNTPRKEILQSNRILGDENEDEEIRVPTKGKSPIIYKVKERDEELSKFKNVIREVHQKNTKDFCCSSLEQEEFQKELQNQLQGLGKNPHIGDVQTREIIFSAGPIKIVMEIGNFKSGIVKEEVKEFGPTPSSIYETPASIKKKYEKRLSIEMKDKNEDANVEGKRYADSILNTPCLRNLQKEKEFLINEITQYEENAQNEEEEITGFNLGSSFHIKPNIYRSNKNIQKNLYSEMLAIDLGNVGLNSYKSPSPDDRKYRMKKNNPPITRALSSRPKIALIPPSEPKEKIGYGFQEKSSFNEGKKIKGMLGSELRKRHLRSASIESCPLNRSKVLLSTSNVGRRGKIDKLWKYIFTLENYIVDLQAEYQKRKEEYQLEIQMIYNMQSSMGENEKDLQRQVEKMSREILSKDIKIKELVKLISISNTKPPSSASASPLLPKNKLALQKNENLTNNREIEEIRNNAFDDYYERKEAELKLESELLLKNKKEVKAKSKKLSQESTRLSILQQKLNDDQQNLEKYLSNARQEFKTLTEERLIHSQKAKELEQRIQEFEDQSQEFQNNKLRFTSEVEMFGSVLKKLGVNMSWDDLSEKRFIGLFEYMSSLKEQIEMVQEELCQYKINFYTTSSALLNAEEQIQIHIGKIKDLTTHNNAAEKNIESLQKLSKNESEKIINLEKEKIDHLAKIEELSNDITKLSEELSDLEEQYNSTKKYSIEASQEIEELKNIGFNLQSKLKKTNGKLKMKAQKFHLKKEEIEALSLKLNKAEANIENLKQQIQLKEDQKKEICTQYQNNLAYLYQKQKEDTEDFNSNRNQVEKEIRTLMREKESMAINISQLKQINQDIQDEIQKSQKTISLNENNLRNAYTQIAKLKAALFRQFKANHIIKRRVSETRYCKEKYIWNPNKIQNILISQFNGKMIRRKSNISLNLDEERLKPLSSYACVELPQSKKPKKNKSDLNKSIEAIPTYKEWLPSKEEIFSRKIRKQISLELEEYYKKPRKDPNMDRVLSLMAHSKNNCKVLTKTLEDLIPIQKMMTEKALSSHQQNLNLQAAYTDLVNKKLFQEKKLDEKKKILIKKSYELKKKEHIISGQAEYLKKYEQKIQQRQKVLLAKEKDLAIFGAKSKLKQKKILYAYTQIKAEWEKIEDNKKKLIEIGKGINDEWNGLIAKTEEMEELHNKLKTDSENANQERQYITKLRLELEAKQAEIKNDLSNILEITKMREIDDRLLEDKKLQINIMKQSLDEYQSQINEQKKMLLSQKCNIEGEKKNMQLIQEDLSMVIPSLQKIVGSLHSKQFTCSSVLTTPEKNNKTDLLPNTQSMFVERDHNLNMSERIFPKLKFTKSKLIHFIDKNSPEGLDESGEISPLKPQERQFLTVDIPKQVTFPSEATPTLNQRAYGDDSYFSMLGSINFSSYTKDIMSSDRKLKSSTRKNVKQISNNQPSIVNPKENDKIVFGSFVDKCRKISDIETPSRKNCRQYSQPAENLIIEEGNIEINEQSFGFEKGLTKAQDESEKDKSSEKSKIEENKELLAKTISISKDFLKFKQSIKQKTYKRNIM